MSEAQNQKREPQPSDVLPEDAPPALRSAANNATDEITAQEEKSALDWLLGATTRLTYTVPVEYETPTGLQTLRFQLQQMDAKRIETIDTENRKGEGPFAKLDTSAFNAQVVAEATIHIEDESGRKVAPESEEFRGQAPSPALAMGARFKYQPGVLEGVAEEIRKSAGYGGDRVGSAQRVMVDAVGG
jgi:hypothetical protein